MRKREEEAQIFPGSQEFAKKICPDGQDLRTYKINPEGSPVGNQLELTQTLLPYYSFFNL